MSAVTNSWGPFVMLLHEMLLHTRMPPLSACPLPDLKDINLDHLVQLLEEAEAPVRAAVEAAVSGWPEQEPPWSELGEIGSYFLRLRMDTSFQFIVQFCMAGAHPETSFLDFPAAYGASEMARFLFTDWWQSHGRGSAAMAILVTYHDAQVGRK